MLNHLSKIASLLMKASTAKARLFSLPPLRHCQCLPTTSPTPTPTPTPTQSTLKWVATAAAVAVAVQTRAKYNERRE